MVLSTEETVHGLAIDCFVIDLLLSLQDCCCWKLDEEGHNLLFWHAPLALWSKRLMLLFSATTTAQLNSRPFSLAIQAIRESLREQSSIGA